MRPPRRPRPRRKCRRARFYVDLRRDRVAGSISGDKASKWVARIEKDEEIKELKRKAEAGDAFSSGILGVKYYYGIDNQNL